MATDRNDILAVVDPTRVEQWALQKAVSIAKNRKESRVYAFLCAYSGTECDDPAELRSVEVRRHTIWLTELLAEYADEAVKIVPIVEWNADWRTAICNTAMDAGVNLVVKRASGRPKALASSDRHLIRSLQTALLLVKHQPAEEMRRVLIAVDFNATDRSHVALNKAIMALGQRIRGSSDSIELHVVSAYSESEKFVHPPDVAKDLEIDRSRAHVRQGHAADVIPHTANEIDADLVIVGSVGRRGFSALKSGNTSEKILTDIHADVLVLVTEEDVERSAA